MKNAIVELPELRILLELLHHYIDRDSPFESISSVLIIEATNILCTSIDYDEDEDIHDIPPSIQIAAYDVILASTDFVDRRTICGFHVIDTYGSLLINH